MENLSIKIRETKQAVINTINASGLHIDIADAIMMDLARSIHELAEQNYQEMLRQQAAAAEEPVEAEEK